MRVIDLDASGWKTPLDLYCALKKVLGSCQGHGSSPDAFVDSMIWGGMNSIEPPYVIRVMNTSSVPKNVSEEIDLMIAVIQRAREWRRANEGTDVEVTLTASG